MDDQISDANARAHARDDAWSPSDGHSARRILIAKARAELAAGRQRFAERQRELDRIRADRDALPCCGACEHGLPCQVDGTTR